MLGGVTPGNDGRRKGLRGQEGVSGLSGREYARDPRIRR